MHPQFTPVQIARFWSHVVKSPGCWHWQLTPHHEGYGQVKLGLKTYQAHRVSWLLIIGPIPEGREMHHTCGNKLCVNPDHLLAVTDMEHSLIDGAACVNRRKTHCAKGHEYSPGNTALYNGKRICRICNRAKQRRKYARKRKGETE